MRFAFSLLLCMLCAGLLQAQKRVAGSRPEITFSTVDIDINSFDWKPEKDYAYYTVTFRNTGDAPVLFTRCQCPCGCYIISDFPKQIIHPGDTGSVKLAFWKRTGMVSKSTYLHTNIPDSLDGSGYRRYEFRVTGELK